MLVWVVALRCEAKPIIDYYRLKKSSAPNAFDIYSNEKMLCIISGIGKTAAAAATAWIATCNLDKGSIAWINIGTAGSAIHAVGTPLWISKISDDESRRNFYPIPLLDTKLETAHCQTLNQASTDYHPHQIYDMEAGAFFDIATQFSNAKLVHCLKIISDNPSQQTGRDKARISQLINTHIDHLASFADSLIDLNDQAVQLEFNDSSGEKYPSCDRC